MACFRSTMMMIMYRPSSAQHSERPHLANTVEWSMPGGSAVCHCHYCSQLLSQCIHCTL